MSRCESREKWSKERKREFISPTEELDCPIINHVYNLCNAINERILKKGAKYTPYENGRPVRLREGYKFVHERVAYHTKGAVNEPRYPLPFDA